MKRVLTALIFGICILGFSGCAEKNPKNDKATDIPENAYLYNCDNGKSLMVTPLGTEGLVLLYEKKSYRMERVKSASGVRFAGEGLEWWTKEGEGFFRTTETEEFDTRCTSVRSGN